MHPWQVWTVKSPPFLENGEKQCWQKRLYSLQIQTQSKLLMRKVIEPQMQLGELAIADIAQSVIKRTL